MSVILVLIIVVNGHELNCVSFSLSVFFFFFRNYFGLVLVFMSVGCFDIKMNKFLLVKILQ